MTRLGWIVSASLVALAWLSAALAYPQLPEQIPTHWNIHGEIDGYGAKWWALFLTPGIMLGAFLMFLALPWLSPRQFAVETFRPTYQFIVVAVLLLIAYIHGLLLWAAWSGPVDISRALMAGICLALAVIGNVLGKVRRNFFVGIRTPWTLASERVWIDTHRLAAWLFVLAGMAGAVAAVVLSQVLSFAVPFALIIAAALASVVYSLVHYKRLERQGQIN
ncbi:MAG TPA: DUF1648 domain-containing protein [Pirellulales bacterium]|nr:DUF1648 domain-containing protein [Pirellulales bacterium]